MHFVAKELVCFSAGCHILFIDINTGEEKIMRANDHRIGEGVGCLTGHKSSKYFAFSEKAFQPQIFIMSYPDFTKVVSLKTNSNDYVSIIFSEAELFLALGGFPSYTMHVWKWRIGEKLLSVDTNLVYGKQTLRSNYSCPVLISQCIPTTKILFVWEFALCGSKCVMSKEPITYRRSEYIYNFVKAIWTTDGGLFVIDEKGHVYMLGHDNKLDRVITWEVEGNKVSMFTWFQNGLLIYGSNGEMKHYKKSGEWVSDWQMSVDYDVKYIRADIGRDYLFCISTDNDILVMDNNTKEFKLFRSDNSGVTKVCMIFPKGEYFVTIAHQKKLSLWRVNTGEMIDRVVVEDKKILTICANPYYPYVSAGCDTGLLEMYSCFNDNLVQLATFQLCRIPIQKVLYGEMGTIIVAANADIGQFFIIKGLPGGKFKVLTSVTANAQISDFIITGTTPCLRLFMIFVTSNRYLAGNGIWRYCITKNEEPTLKKYELENPERFYSKLYLSWKPMLRDRFFYAVPLDCKNLHELETKRGDTHARIVDRIKSNHMMKNIRYKWNGEHLITYAYDGLIMLKDNNFKTIRDVVMPHHRVDGGVQVAYSDPQGQRIISLGMDGLLVCTVLTERKEDLELTLKIENKMKSCMEMFTTPSIGFQPTGIFDGKSWLEYKELMKCEAERIRFEKERNKLVSDLMKIRAEVTRLLEKNLAGPENEFLDIQEFNLDNAKKEERVKTSKDLCELTKMHMLKLIAENERVAKLIKAKFWDTIDTQTKNMWAIFGNFDVQSYCILPPDGTKAERLHRIEEYRKVEEMLSKDDLFTPWICKTKEEIQEHMEREPRITHEESRFSVAADSMDFEDLTEEEQKALKEQYLKELEHFTAFSGNTVHLYAESNKHHYSQFEQQTFYQHLWELIMGQNDQQMLREFFNKQFESTFQNKIREMGNIIEKNARLRYILSELNYFSEEKLDISIEDPTWKQDEDPDQLIVVKNEEVWITPYISPSEQAILDAKAAEAERIRLLLLADDFKERALMAMMNGVLEIRWEDELRKEVPKPKCMLEKEPEEFNEEDLRTIKDYEEKVAFLKSERERYKVILTNEYAKVGSHVREGVKKFNEKLQELLLLKLQIESAITQEILRTNRLKKWDVMRCDVEKQEESIRNSISENEAKAEGFHKVVATLHSFINEIRSNLELFQNKDKTIDKSFKKEFLDASTSQLEILLKYYRKRPKANLRAINSSCILNELANCVLLNTKSVLLNPEALEFWKLLEQMDKFVGIPTMIDARLYATVCKQRRIKIENELRIRALQLDLSEAESTSAMHHKAVVRCKEQTQYLLHKHDTIRARKLQNSMNMEIQVVLREGYSEIPRTGSLSDFTDAIMISRTVVEDINKIIIETGLKKIKAMRSAMNFKNEIFMMEWEHRKRKMEIADLKYNLVDVGSVNVTKEIQTYLKARARGDNTDKGYSIEDEIQNMKNVYMRMIDDRNGKVQRAQDRLDVLKGENKQIQKQINIINVDVNEYRLNINEKLLKDNEKIIRLRMAAHMKRSKLITQIQANQQEIFVLQTELELLRLRTVPVLEYKVDV